MLSLMIAVCIKKCKETGWIHSTIQHAWIAMIFSTDIHGPKVMKSTHF